MKTIILLILALLSISCAVAPVDTIGNTLVYDSEGNIYRLYKTSDSTYTVEYPVKVLPTDKFVKVKKHLKQ